MNDSTSPYNYNGKGTFETLNSVLNRVSYEDFYKLLCKNSKREICSILGITTKMYSKLYRHFKNQGLDVNVDRKEFFKLRPDLNGSKSDKIIIINGNYFVKDMSDDQIIEFLKDHLTSELAQHLHIKEYALTQILSRLNISSKDINEAVKCKRRENKSINHAFSIISKYGINDIISYYETHSVASCSDHFHISVKIASLIINKILNLQEHTIDERKEFSIHNREESCMRSYGFTNAAASPSVKKKIAITFLEKYGCNPLSNSEIRAKCNYTKLIKYGDSNYNNREKAAQTMQDLYGVDCYSKCEDGKLKAKKAAIKRREIRFTSIDKNELEDFYNENSTHAVGIKYHMHTKQVVRLLKYYNIEPHTKELDIQLMTAHINEVCTNKYGMPPWALGIQSQVKNGIHRGKDSRPELQFGKLLNLNNISYEREFYLDKKFFDFKVENKLIELNPTVTHNTFWNPYCKDSSNTISEDYHLVKSNIAKQNGFKCIHVWDWDNKDLIVSLLSNRKRIYARSCDIRLVDKENEKLFLDKYHLQGYVKSKLAIGLYHNDELVSIMTFGKPRYNKKCDCELLRFCESYMIVGGAEKLWHFFITNYNYKCIVSYCDLSKFSGTVYDKLKFSLSSISKPTRHWYNLKTKEHYTDNYIRQHGVDRIFDTDFGKGTSNEELMLTLNFLPVYDCGQATYIYRRTE